MARLAYAAVSLALSCAAASAKPMRDATEVTLDRCLSLPANASTAGQTDCETAAMRSYDRRMNAAYRALIRRLPPIAAGRLRASQRAWLAFRDAEAGTRRAIYATRQGTMYVPMEADAAVTLVGDRTRLLEGYVRVLGVE